MSSPGSGSSTGGTGESNLLGVCDGQLDPGRHRSSFLTNKVGGRPDWLPGLRQPSPRCGRCAARSVLVAQVYCPLDASPYHRNLHLFACLGPDCSSWTVLRSQGLETEASGRPEPPQEAPLAATDWCDTADDWGMEEEEEEGGERKDSLVQEGQGRTEPRQYQCKSAMNGCRFRARAATAYRNSLSFFLT